MKKWAPTLKRSDSESFGGNVRAQLQQAMALLKSDRLDEAATALRAVIASNPEIAAAHLGLGNLYYRQGQLSQALASYQQALDLNPKLLPAMVLHGNVLAETGDLEGALHEYESAIEIDPEFSSAKVKAGRIHGEQGRFEEAERLCQEVIQSNPQSLPARLLLAEIYRKQGLLDSAIAELNRALGMNPDAWVVHYRLGTIYLKQRDFSNALATFDQLLELKPDTAAGYFLLGLSAMGVEDYDSAEQALVRALELKSDLATARMQLARVYEKQGRFREGQALVRELLRKRPKAAALHRLLGDLFLAEEKVSESLEEYLAAVNHLPEETLERYPDLITASSGEMDDKSRAAALHEAFAKVKFPRPERQRPTQQSGAARERRRLLVRDAIQGRRQ
jgi:tetratricopeptide (TPR) repeat protein